MPVRVLIVDDAEAFRRAAALVIQATAGFEVAGEAVDGEASVTAAADLRPDIVLMDVNLPGIDGIEATRRIRAALPETKVVLLSTRDDGEFAWQAAECGAVAYLPKAMLTPDRLAGLIRNGGVNRWQQRRRR
jgi:DNA-binding NarL/FixJ family response regulator